MHIVCLKYKVLTQKYNAKLLVASHYDKTFSYSHPAATLVLSQFHDVTKCLNTSLVPRRNIFPGVSHLFLYAFFHALLHVFLHAHLYAFLHAH